MHKAAFGFWNEKKLAYMSHDTQASTFLTNQVSTFLSNQAGTFLGNQAVTFFSNQVSAFINNLKHSKL